MGLCRCCFLHRLEIRREYRLSRHTDRLWNLRASCSTAFHLHPSFRYRSSCRVYPMTSRPSWLRQVCCHLECMFPKPMRPKSK